MFNSGKKVTIELIEKEMNNKMRDVLSNMSNPVTCDDYSDTDRLSMMISSIIEQEIPQLKNNSLLFDLVQYSILEKMKTVQSVENVLSYMKETNVKTVEDVSFVNGEVRIKCSI